MLEPGELLHLMSWIWTLKNMCNENLRNTDYWINAKKLSFPFIILGMKKMIPNLDSSKLQQKEQNLIFKYFVFILFEHMYVTCEVYVMCAYLK